MANADSNTFAYTEMTKDQMIIAQDIAALLKMPLGAKDDLFHVLDICSCWVDELAETHSHAEYIALVGRLQAGFNVLRVVLTHPLPQHLIERLTVEEGHAAAPCTVSEADSDVLCEYCSAVTQVLLGQQLEQAQQVQMTDLLSQLFSLLEENLTAPRFVRTKKGLAWTNGELVQGLH
ncbi:hypothetical protein F3J28_08865 [Enterobacter sp. Ap-1006]|uniref:hypothetical protein n=1 Tax=Enterobacter sp. Ap-1006 TaxID=2608345 RepID=UPI00141DD40D|nr:hypothetical protein [Enterobacter sp. Ap-1006]NIF47877.1 hypothetical protein [Enterobacter sp. Ap-1006]